MHLVLIINGLTATGGFFLNYTGMSFFKYSTNIRFLLLGLVLVMFACGGNTKASVPERLSCERRNVIQDYDLLKDFVWSTEIQLTLVCSSNFAFNGKIARVRGLTQADFTNQEITIVTHNSLVDDEFLTTLVHELAHAKQFSRWMLSTNTNMTKKLQRIHDLNGHIGLNGAFQVLAKIKKQPEFALQSKTWQQAYVTVRLCMEMDAYQQEAVMIQTKRLSVADQTPEMRSLIQGKPRPMLDWLNKGIVVKHFGFAFDWRELMQAQEICSVAQEPVGWFSAAVTALNLKTELK